MGLKMLNKIVLLVFCTGFITLPISCSFISDVAKDLEPVAEKVIEDEIEKEIKKQ